MYTNKRVEVFKVLNRTSVEASRGVDRGVVDTRDCAGGVERELERAGENFKKSLLFLL